MARHGLLRNGWQVRIDGRTVEGSHSLEGVDLYRKAYPHALIQARLLEADGSVSSDSPWIEPYDDKRLFNLVGGALILTLGTASCAIGAWLGRLVFVKVDGDWLMKMAWALLTGIVSAATALAAIWVLLFRVLPYVPAFVKGVLPGAFGGALLFAFLGALLNGTNGLVALSVLGAALGGLYGGWRCAKEAYRRNLP